MSRYRRRTMRDMAWRAVAWRHPYAVLAWPFIKAGLLLGAGYLMLAWLWFHVPHLVLAGGCLALAAIVVALVATKRDGVSVAGRLLELRRPAAKWALVTVGVAALAGAAWTAIGGPW